MSLYSLALAYVLHRRGVSTLTALSVALGLALVLLVLAVRRDIDRAFARQSSGYDLIAGAPGSDAAIVLSSLFHVDRPRGNVAYRVVGELERLPGVRAVYPFCLGDEARGMRIVGTTRAFLEQTKSGGEPLFSLASGRLFEKDFELVVGAAAAEAQGLSEGSTVVGRHAGKEEHSQHPFTVVGVLAPTGTAQDRAAFTTMTSYWTIHGQDRSSARGFGGPEPEVTTLLLKVDRPRIFEIQALLPRRFGIVAARPAEVLQGIVTEVVSPVERVLLVYGYAVVAVAAISVLTTLHLATLVRRRDLAILRALGASVLEVAAVVVLEAGLLLVAGAAVGVVGSQLAAYLFRGDLLLRFGLAATPFVFSPAEAWTVLAVLVLGLAASLLPALAIYRLDVADLLHGD